MHVARLSHASAMMTLGTYARDAGDAGGGRPLRAAVRELTERSHAGVSGGRVWSGIVGRIRQTANETARNPYKAVRGEMGVLGIDLIGRIN